MTRYMNTKVRHTFVPQPGPQVAFLNSPCDITIYGGSRGGGKTYAVLGEFWIHAEMHGGQALGLIVRKNREDLKDTIAVGQQMYGNAAKYIEKNNMFRFGNGARLYCAYLEKDKDADHYQGWNLTRVYIEELTQFATPTPVFRLLGALRSSGGVKVKLCGTCNPGGVGHGWVKDWIIDNGPYNVVADPETGLTRVFIPAKLTDNPALLANDPGYIARLRSVGSPQLVEAWLNGNWDVIESAFFGEFSRDRHVLEPFHLPPHWTRFMAGDWGSAKPFSFGWYAVVQDEFTHHGKRIPRGAIIRYREYYGAMPGKTNTGLKLPAETVAGQIKARERDNGIGERISYRVLDPAAFAVVSGPSIGETLMRQGVNFRRADNSRRSIGKRMGGWDQVRARLAGNPDGDPMLFFFSNNFHLLRTLPVMQHAEHDSEDLDTDAEDHAVDELRYACMSRPFLVRSQNVHDPAKNPWLVSNAFGLDKL